MTPAVIFTPNDINVVFPALVLLKNLSPDQGNTPEYDALARAFYPHQTGAAPFEFTPVHIRIVLNALITFYGFAQSGVTKIEGKNGEDLSPLAAQRSRDLIERMYAWLKLPLENVPGLLENSIRKAQDHVKELWVKQGRIVATDGRA